MRNILEHVRKRDYEEVKRGAQAIYRAESRRQAEAASRRSQATDATDGVLCECEKRRSNHLL
jgi:hypothetical protein